MATVAIISEYNPFHNGHKYQIDEIRNTFGKNTEIIAIMSGNYTQRGELAIADKTVRAKSAVLGGVNLVLEIPFPFSLTSAEFYASSGVKIANALGVVDYLSFGSELGDIAALEKIAFNMLSERYKKTLEGMQNDNSHIGYAKLCELAYNEAFPEEGFKDIYTPNNILAIEYIKALKKTNSRIIPHTIKRQGADYNQTAIVKGELQSAGAIRKIITHRLDTAERYMPNSTKSAYSDAHSSGDFPSDLEVLSPLVLSSFLLNSHCENPDIHDTAGGLYNRLLTNARRSKSISELVSLTETKHYTTARIRRSIWFSLFGVTSSEVRTAPLFSQILAMDSVGKQILKRIRKSGGLPLLTKPSATSTLSADALLQKERADIADSLYGLTLPKKRPFEDTLKFTPFVK